MNICKRIILFKLNSRHSQFQYEYMNTLYLFAFFSVLLKRHIVDKKEKKKTCANISLVKHNSVVLRRYYSQFFINNPTIFTSKKLFPIYS
jgi:hypothetical protein